MILGGGRLSHPQVWCRSFFKCCRRYPCPLTFLSSSFPKRPSFCAGRLPQLSPKLPPRSPPGPAGRLQREGTLHLRPQSWSGLGPEQGARQVSLRPRAPPLTMRRCPGRLGPRQSQGRGGGGRLGGAAGLLAFPEPAPLFLSGAR